MNAEIQINFKYLCTSKKEIPKKDWSETHIFFVFLQKIWRNKFKYIGLRNKKQKILTRRKDLYSLPIYPDPVPKKNLPFYNKLTVYLFIQEL